MPRTMAAEGPVPPGSGASVTEGRDPMAELVHLPPFAEDLPNANPQEARAQLVKAEQLVSDFTAQNALPALDALLKAAENSLSESGDGSLGQAAEGARAVARDIDQRTGVLDKEVARFLSVALRKQS